MRKEDPGSAVHVENRRLDAEAVGLMEKGIRLTGETEEEAEARAQAILELARQSYVGLSEEEMAAVEAARLDTTRFFTSRESVS